MPTDGSRSLREARRDYYKAAGLPPDGGDSDRWVRVKLGPITVAFPNTDGRRRAVRYHDLHHSLASYGTDLTGEGEIAAWELASGCFQFPAAVLLNAIAMGFVVAGRPRAVFCALRRGRRSRNLYGEPFDDALLDRHVGEVRADLLLDREVPAVTPGDLFSFAGWVGVGFLLVWGVPIAGLWALLH
ncbi:hypothetical protein MK489_02580 [Myxococcota bacterium]|nr:hypothetical protein [Myxococcota bacterium]